MAETPKLNASILSNLSEEEKALALKIFKELSETGTSNLFNDLLYEDYAEIPVDILTFVDDPEYLGNAWHDAQGNSKLYPYWRKELVKIFPNNLDTAVNNAIFSGSRGRGKAQPLDSLVFTEFGYKRMGDLTLQDRVYGQDGKLHNIVGIYPQGEKPICKVSFTDGTSTLCCDEHLWRVETLGDKHRAKKYNVAPKVLTTKELYKKSLTRSYKGKKEHLFYIPICKPIQFKSKSSLFISPYILGCLLGDGYLGNHNVRLTSNDQEIIDNISKELHSDYQIKKLPSSLYEYNTCKKIRNNEPNLYSKAIETLGLDKGSKDKFIPEDYLFSSVENRIALLQGLMDTDGTIVKDGSRITFDTISPQLRDNIIFLVQSLGGTATSFTRHPFYKNKEGEKILGEDSYSIKIKLPKDIIPFRLSRKINRLKATRKEPSRYIDKIEYVGKAECQCIYVDYEDHLYLTNDLIVTHNTEIATLIAAYLLHRILCLKNPIEHFHLKSTEKIVFAFMNIKLALAEEIATTKFQNTIKMSPWFLAHGTLEGRTKKVWVPRKYLNENGEEQEVIDIKIGSQPDDVIGLPIYYCLSGDTQILTANGVFKIEDLENKTIKVFNINDSKDAVLSKDCTVKMTAKSTEAYKIELEDGTVLECTPNHKFMLLDGSYKKAQELTEEDEILEYTPVGYIYKITNLENGDFYIGQHKKPYFDKNYYGSGVVAKRVYKKYGRNSLKVEVLDWAKTLDELNKKEEYYIDKYYLDDHNINISKTAVKGNEHPLDWEKRKHYYTNGIETKIFKDNEVPEGYVLTTANKNKKAVTDGKIVRFIDEKDPIPVGFYYGNACTSEKHDMSNYYNDPETRLKNSQAKSGKHNSMYGKGYKVSGDKNGRFGKPASTLAVERAKKANTKYIYRINGKTFYGIDELQNYLHSLGYFISDTGIEGIINKGNRISKKYPELYIEKEVIDSED